MNYNNQDNFKHIVILYAMANQALPAIAKSFYVNAYEMKRNKASR